MALPSSGNLSFSQILTEFDAPIGTKLSQLYRGGAYVPNTAANAGVPTAGAIAVRDFLGASNTLPLGVNVANHTVTAIEIPEANPDPPPTTVYGAAIAKIQVLNTGVLRGNYTTGAAGGATANTNYAGEWRVAGASADYDVRASVVSGAVSSGSMGAWLNCGTTREWSYVFAAAGSSSCVIKLEFRPAGGGTVLDSCNITLTCQR